MKKLSIVVLLVSILCVFTACGNKIVGENGNTYTKDSIKTSLVGEWKTEIGVSYIFNSDDTFQCVALETKEGTYTIEKDEIKLKYESGAENSLKFTIDENQKLKVLFGNQELTKQKK